MSQLSSVSPKAKIGSNVKIEPFAVIYDDVVIGDNSWIGPGAVIFNGARIGKNCQIFPGAIISPVSQDLKYKGEETFVEIGDNTIIREHATIHKGTVDKVTTRVGSNCLIMSAVHLAHDVQVGNNVIIASGTGIAGHVVIDDFVIIEAMVGIQQFIHIGSHAFIGGMSGLTKNVPPYVRTSKTPAVYIGVNSIGLERRGFSKESIRTIEDIYRLIYVRGLNMTNALAQIEKDIPDSKERKYILDFIKASPSGIIKGPL